MNKFKFKKVAIGLITSAMVSSGFVSNTVGMEENNSKTKHGLELEKIEKLVCNISKMIYEIKSDTTLIDSNLLRVAKLLVSLAKYKSKLSKPDMYRFCKMIKYLVFIRTSYGHSSWNEYPSLFAYMEKQQKIFG